MAGNVAEKVKSLAREMLRDKRRLIKILSIAVILLLALILKLHDSDQSDITVEAVSELPEVEELCIDIGGAVNNPGVYTVEAGTRLYEVIELAGGLRSDADTDSVNQAAFVEDGAKIIIPIAAFVQNGEGVEAENTQSSTENTSQLSNNSSGFININTANKDQLKSLSGIGDVIAERIIEYRTNKRFNKKEDIMLVKGVGNSIFEVIKDRIIV